jgi:predicted nuclease with TOPRIM domain
MSEDLTQNLPNTFQNRVLAEFAAMRQEFAGLNSRMTSLEDRMTSIEGRMTSLEDRLTSVEGRLTAVENRLVSVEDRVLSIDTRLNLLEDKVDARLRETRPIWEGVLERLKNIESELSNLNRQFRSLLADIFQVRVCVEKLEDAQQSS